MFIPKSIGGKTFFNLSFGDWDESAKGYNDKAISTIKDRPKILTTVARAVQKFSTYFPDVPIYAEGALRMDSGNRLKRMLNYLTRHSWFNVNEIFKFVKRSKHAKNKKEKNIPGSISLSATKTVKSVNSPVLLKVPTALWRSSKSMDFQRKSLRGRHEKLNDLQTRTLNTNDPLSVHHLHQSNPMKITLYPDLSLTLVIHNRK
ncbi:MAG: hypothetical protein WDO15_09175 [Bacteroidota bacterium]